MNKARLWYVGSQGPMRTALLVLLFFAAPALADTDTFYGWSKDGSYFVYQSVSGPNDLVELFFCITDEAVAPSWAKELNDLERMGSPFSCARYTDVNRAPYAWKSAVALPRPSLAGPGGARALTELVLDGDRPGYAFEAGGKKTVCYASGMHEDSKLGSVYWQPGGRFLAAFVDGRFIHCDVTLKPAIAAKAPKKKTK